MQFNKNITSLPALLNAWCREFPNWSRYAGRTQHDPVLREQMQQYDAALHLRFDFAGQGSEVFAPVTYYSNTGAHLFGTPVWERHLENNTIKLLTTDRFQELAVAYATTALQHIETGSQLVSGTNRPVTGDDQYSLSDLIAPTEEGGPKVIALISAMDPALSSEECALAWFGEYTKHWLTVSAGYGQKDADNRFWMDEVLSCFLPLIAKLGRHQLIGERILLGELYRCIAEHGDERLIILLQARNISRKGVLFEDKVYETRYPNPLQEYFVLEEVFSPQGGAAVFSRYFPKEDITVTIRPFDPDKDLELAYQWYHEEHAKPVWKMDWPMEQLELFYRTITANEYAHSYIGEINGVPTFNLEVYWVTRDVLGEYYDVLPDDYGTHLLIAPTDKKKKFPSATMQTILDWLFGQPLIGRLVGEGSVDSLPALMNKVHVGFRLDRVLDMPHKRSHLNFCYRDWYWAKFPENKNDTLLSPSHKTTLHGPATSI